MSVIYVLILSFAQYIVKDFLPGYSLFATRFRLNEVRNGT